MSDDPKLCRLYDCDGARYSLELCRPHYRRQRLYGDPRASGRVGPEVTTPAAFTARGLTRRQITYWCNRGYLDAPVTGDHRRRWTPNEVRVALVIANLVQARLPLDEAARLAREVVAGRTEHDLAPGVRLLVEPPDSLLEKAS